MSPTVRLPAAAVLISAATVVAAVTPQDGPERLGRVRFATSCAAAAQGPFERAVALLHSFSFGAASRGFGAALERDPACAIAYWGIALSQGGNPFGGMRSPKALAEGRAAVERGLKMGSPTPRERDYLAAAAELYRDYEAVDQRTRILAYERAMERVYEAYPDDREAAAFYALAVNQSMLPNDKTYAKQLQAAKILEALWQDQPQHPGIPHYIIHAYDHPPLAERALTAARSYGKIAPSAPHALHMPSHTFTRVGFWQESIDTNRASAAAAIRDGTFPEALHAMDYQVYAYLQTAQDAAARRVSEEAPQIAARIDLDGIGGAAPAPAGLYAFAAIPARYALERGAWAEAAALAPGPAAYPFALAVTHFARAIGAARSGKADAAPADAARLAELRDKLAAARDGYWTEQVDIQHQVASAWIALTEDRREEALTALRKAADAEDATDKNAISPGPLAPARELLGDMLLELGQPAAALLELEATMKKEPRRFRTTALAARAAVRAGDTTKARAYYKQLLELAVAADTPGRTELAEAREYLRQ
jgi:hypothetical protein